MYRATTLFFLGACAHVHAQSGPFAAPFCFVWPGADNERCDAFFGFGFGMCEEGYDATWMGTCEDEHDDDHDHMTEFEDHVHINNFEHDDKPPPPSPSPPT